MKLEMRIEIPKMKNTEIHNYDFVICENRKMRIISVTICYSFEVNLTKIDDLFAKLVVSSMWFRHRQNV